MTTNASSTVTLAEAAARLGVSTRTVQRRIAAGAIPAGRDESGQLRIPLEAVRPSERSPEVLAVSDTVSHVMTSYAASLNRLERSRSRWTLAAVAGVALGVMGMTTAVAVSWSASRQGDTLADTTAALTTTGSALVESQREIRDLRTAVTEADRMADTWRTEAHDNRQAVSRLSADLALAIAERDAMACQADTDDALAYLASVLD